MTFTTGIFGLFLGLALAIYWATPARWRKYVMIGAGMFFYGYYLPRYLLLIGTMVAVTYSAARVIISLRRREGPERAGKTRPLFIAGIVFSLLVLGFFKYWKMIVDSLNTLLAWLDWGVSIPLPHILVPLGISYITFELVHYLSDVYTGKIKPETVKAADLALFTFFFPTMVSGPIKRYQQFQQQTAARLPFDRETFFYGAYRVVLGIGKKFIIADTAGRFTTVLANPETAAPGMLVLGIYAYAIKIYFDFAGYSDMAIGISRMFGYRVPENFDRPYLQPNIAEFWRRWHMSLSSWIRDYIYIPLGGSRRGLPRTLANLVIAFTLCGLWHGAAWNFVAWGAWHGLGMAAYRLWRRLITGATSTAGTAAVAGAGISSSSGTVSAGDRQLTTGSSSGSGRVVARLPNHLGYGEGFSDAGAGTSANGGAGGGGGGNGSSYGIKQLFARAVGIFLTFHFVTAGWVLFAAPDLTTAIEIFTRCLALL